MIKYFKYPEPDSISNMVMIRRNLNQILDALYKKEIPNSTEFTIEDLQYFCSSLIKNQKKRLNQYFPAGSWCLMNKELLNTAPSDARFDFVDLPSYVALSILVFIKINYPKIAYSLDNYDCAILKGLQFSTARKLHGHGFDITDNQEEIIEVFYKGEVLKYTAKNSKIYPEFNEMLKNHLIYLKNCLRNPRSAGFYTFSAEDYQRMIKPLEKFYKL